MTHLSGYFALALLVTVAAAAPGRAADPSEPAVPAGATTVDRRGPAASAGDAPAPARGGQGAAAITARSVGAAANADIHLLNSWNSGDPYHTWRGLERQ